MKYTIYKFYKRKKEDIAGYGEIRALSTLLTVELTIKKRSLKRPFSCVTT